MPESLKKGFKNLGYKVGGKVTRLVHLPDLLPQGRMRNLHSSDMSRDIKARLQTSGNENLKLSEEIYNNLISFIIHFQTIIPESSAAERIPLVSIYQFLEAKNKSGELTISSQDLNKLVTDLSTCLGLNTYGTMLGLKVVNFSNLVNFLRFTTGNKSIPIQINRVDQVVDLLKSLKSLNTKLSGDKTMPALLDFDDNELQSAAYAKLIQFNKGLPEIRQFKLDSKYGDRNYNLPEGEIFWNKPLSEVYKFFGSAESKIKDKISYLKHYITTENFRYGFEIVKELLELIEISDHTISSTNGQIVFDIFEDFINSGYFEKFKNQFFILMMWYLSNHKFASEKFTDYIVAQGKGSDFENILDNSGNTIPKNVAVLDDAITNYSKSLEKSFEKESELSEQRIKWKSKTSVVTAPSPPVAPTVPVVTEPFVPAPPTPVAQPGYTPPPFVPAPPSPAIPTPPRPVVTDPLDPALVDFDDEDPPDVEEGLDPMLPSPDPMPQLQTPFTQPRPVVTDPLVLTPPVQTPFTPDPLDDSRPVSIMPLDTSNIDQLAFDNFLGKLVQNRAKVLGYLTELGLPEVMLDQLGYPENPMLNNGFTLQFYYKSMHRFFYSTDAEEKRRMGLIEFLERIPAYKSNPKLNGLKTLIDSIFQEIESQIIGIGYDTDVLKADLKKNEKQLPINLTTNDLSFINTYSVNPATKKMLELFLGDTNDLSIVKAINLVIKFKGDLQNVKELYKLGFPDGVDRAKIYKHFFAAFENSQIYAYLESIRDLETTESISKTKKIMGGRIPFGTSTEERKVVKLSEDFIIALTSIDYSVISSTVDDNKAIVDRLYSDPDTLVSSFDKFSSELKTDILLRYLINDERKPTWIKLVQKDFGTSKDLYRYFTFPEDITNPPKPDGNNRFELNFKNAGIRKFLYILKELDLEGKGYLEFLNLIGSLDSLKGATNGNEFNNLKNKITQYLNTKAKPEYRSFVDAVLLPELNRISFTEEVITAKPAPEVKHISKEVSDAPAKMIVRLDQVLNNDIHTINLEKLYQGHYQRIQKGESLSDDDMVAFLGQILYVLVNAKDTLEDDPDQIKHLVELINFAKQYLSELVSSVPFNERDSLLQQRGLQGIYFVVKDMSLPKDIATIKFDNLVKTIKDSVKPHEAKTIRILPRDGTIFSIRGMQKPVIHEEFEEELEPPDDDQEFVFPPSVTTENPPGVQGEQRLSSDPDIVPSPPAVSITETEKNPKRFNKPSPDNIVISEDIANEYLLATDSDISDSYFIDSEKNRALFFDVKYINKVKALLGNLTQDKFNTLEDIITKNGSFKRLYDITDEDTLRVFISTSDNNNDGNKLLPLIKNNPDSKNSLISSFSNTFDTIKGKINKNEKSFDPSEILLFTLIARFIDIDKLIKE